MDAAREAYLEFLRNLTPQVLTTTIALVFLYTGNSERGGCAKAAWYVVAGMFGLVALSAVILSAIQLSRKLQETHVNTPIFASVIAAINLLALGVYVWAALGADKILAR